MAIPVGYMPKNAIVNVWLWTECGTGKHYSHYKQVFWWSVTTMSSDSDELDFVYCSTNRKLYVKADQIGGWEHTWGIYLYLIGYTT